MSATGKDTSSASTSSFVSALVLGLVVVGALTLAFVVLRPMKRFATTYETRRYLAPEGKRPSQLPNNLFAWWRHILFTTPDTEIIRNNGPDAYLFVRFLKVFGLYMLVPYVLLCIIILVPVAAASPNAGLTGLNILTFGNVATNHQNRHIAHFLVAIVLIFWTLYLIHREYDHLMHIRQQWLASDQHQRLARTRTVMLVNVPEKYMDEVALKELAGTQVGSAGVAKVWLTREIKDMEDVYDDRNKECLRLEANEAKLQALATKNVKKGKTPQAKSTSPRKPASPEDGQEAIDLNAESGGSDAIIDRYVLPKKRPTWKQGFLGLIGKKMDLKDSPEFIAAKNEELNGLRAKYDECKQGNVAFMRFNNQHDAHLFARLIGASKENKYVKSGVEVVPEDIEWNNTSMNPHQRTVRKIISWALTIGLIIIWAIPVAFVGAVSNINTLCSKASFLAWICTLPVPVVGIIQGVLPPVLLAVLFMVLMIILRQLVKFQAYPRKSDSEVELFSRYWLFQVIHGFLIVTVTSGLVNALSNLGGTLNSVPTLLANNLPGASIFFLTFILTATWSSAAQAYSRITPAVMTFVTPLLAGKTPRKHYAAYHKMSSFTWATVFPPICLIICITIVYSVIQPLITVLALVAFFLLYCAYKYTLGWCADQPDALETGGLFYPKALTTIFVSLYLEEVCLAGLLFLSTDENGKRAKSGLAGGVIMAVMIAVTAVAQIMIERKFNLERIVYSSSSIDGASSTAKLALQPTNDDEAGEPYGNTTGMHEKAFDHPATWKPQPVVWLSNDTLGIGRAEVRRIEETRVKASTEFAEMDADGKLHVERPAPDEAWYGGRTTDQ